MPIWKADEGERAALALAVFLGADLVLMDDREGVRIARSNGFRVIGTLRVLQLAAGRGLIDLADSPSSGSGARISGTGRKYWINCSIPPPSKTRSRKHQPLFRDRSAMPSKVFTDIPLVAHEAIVGNYEPQRPVGAVRDTDARGGFYLNW